MQISETERTTTLTTLVLDVQELETILHGLLEVAGWTVTDGMVVSPQQAKELAQQIKKYYAQTEARDARDAYLADLFSGKFNEPPDCQPSRA